MTAAALELRGVEKRFSKRRILRGVDLAVPRGSLFGLIGLNGAGKTTTLRIALGLLRPDRGRVSCLGESPGRLFERSPAVGAALHQPGLDPRLCVTDVLRQHALLHGRRARVDDALERMGLEHLARQRVSRLSQGERQRVALTRALLLEPELLILDEPLTHLDPGAVHGVLEALRRESERGATVVLSSHQLEHVERTADRLALLHDGCVLLQGEVKDLMESVSRNVVVRAEPHDRALAVLRALPEVVGAELSGDGDLPVIRAELAGDDAATVNRALHDAGVRVSMLAGEARSLDDVFRDAIEGAAGKAEQRPLREEAIA